jgi:hypothetical protein
MTRRRSKRTVLGAVGRLDQLLQRVVPALEDQGGEEGDLFDLVSRIPQGEHWLAMAILERLGVYQVSLPSGNFLARLLERADIRLNLDRLPPQLQASVTISTVQGAESLEDEMTLEFPLLCEAYDGHGDPMVARVAFLKYWRRKGRLPATVEQVLELLIDDRDLPIWQDRILIFGSECLLGQGEERVNAFLQLSPTGQLEPLSQDYSLYLNKPEVRVAFVRGQGE